MEERAERTVDVKHIEKKTVLVTGSSVGIGRAIALRFAAAGAYRLVINYATQSGAADAVVREIQESGGEAFAIRTNVADSVAVTEMFKEIDSTWGSVDILINNAGITRDGLVMRMSETDWNDVLHTNLNGAFYCSQAALRGMMKKRWGRIVNIASVVGVIGNAGQANYAASKAGLIGLTKAMAKELATRHITVNALAPGFIRSAMTDKLTEEQRASIIGTIPVGWFGEPEDVAAVAFFLATEEARYITGQVLHIDGGMAM